MKKEKQIFAFGLLVALGCFGVSNMTETIYANEISASPEYKVTIPEELDMGDIVAGEDSVTEYQVEVTNLTSGSVVVSTQTSVAMASAETSFSCNNDLSSYTFVEDGVISSTLTVSGEDTIDYPAGAYEGAMSFVIAYIPEDGDDSEGDSNSGSGSGSGSSGGSGGSSSSSTSDDETVTNTQTLTSDNGTIVLNENALSAISEQMAENLKFDAQLVDTESLTDAIKELVGDAPVYQLGLSADDTEITEFGDDAMTVTLSYVLQDGENPELLVVYYIDEDGNTTELETFYDVENEEVVFATDTLGIFTIGTKTSWANPFDDVSEDSWFFSAIQFVVEHNLFSGITETSFGPNDSMTRAMLVTVLYRLEGSPAVDATTSSFTDVQADAYYESPVVWATEKGIVSGYDSETFAPNEVITREQLVSILQRYTLYKGEYIEMEYDLSGYQDVGEISSYATEAFAWAVEKGIVSGTFETELSPKSGATRAQVARILENIAK